MYIYTYLSVKVTIASLNGWSRRTRHPRPSEYDSYPKRIPTRSGSTWYQCRSYKRLNWLISKYVGVLWSSVCDVFPCLYWLWIWSYEGQKEMKSTWFPRISYKLVNIYTCILIASNGRRYLLAVDTALLRENTTWNRPNITADNWLIYTNVGVLWLSQFDVCPYLLIVDHIFFFMADIE